MRLASCLLNGRTGHEAAWDLLAQLYREETGLPLPEVLRTEAGRPYFVSSPYFFSITHTPRHAFCALGKVPVGIDAEELDRKIRPGFAERVLSASELEQYHRAADPRRALLTFWVLKEAQAKFHGTGLTGFPNHTHFSLNDPRVQEWDGCMVAVITEDNHAV